MHTNGVRECCRRNIPAIPNPIGADVTTSYGIGQGYKRTVLKFAQCPVYGSVWMTVTQDGSDHQDTFRTRLSRDII